jgi:hypothetical protein
VIENLKKAFRERFIEKTKLPESTPSIVMLVYDSCRYDSAVKANTPNLDAHSKIYKAYAPATYTYPSHQSFFCGIFPSVLEPSPYYNRFIKQLIVLRGAGDSIIEAEEGECTFIVKKNAENIVLGLAKAGYYTVGSGGANWFVKKSLRVGFKDFYYKSHARALDQINIILRLLNSNRKGKPFFAFINFMETHTPYMHYGEKEYHMTARRKMTWPPKFCAEDVEYGQKLHNAQIRAVEYLDTCIPKLLDVLPHNTIVMLFGDHGEAFGEDGYWGHGIYHEKVMEVPMSIFTL